LIPNWVEETLRYDPSTQALARIATTDIKFGDVRVGEGDRVYLLIGSGNRDEEIFERADSYAIERDTSRSLHFGQGTHFCLGAALARLEGKVVLEEVVRRMPNFEIDADAAERVHSINVRGFAKLPMTL
ncbi:MAG: cytochrome P450, partial [Deltaproteobacteria bacterium]